MSSSYSAHVFIIPMLPSSSYPRDTFKLIIMLSRLFGTSKPEKSEAAPTVTENGGRPDEITNRVYMRIDVDGQPIGTINMGLYGNAAPKTCENFRQLCRGVQTKSGRLLSYRNSIFHRIIPGFMCQGGDITNFNGTGGWSIYGANFEDEIHPALKHNRAYLLSMANRGPNTNSSQFFITTTACPHLDGRHTVFGEVIDDPSKRVVDKIEKLGSRSGAVSSNVSVGDCGELPM